MKIFTSAQIHELDKYTIENEPISSIDLMERASTMLTNAIVDTWQASTPVVVFAGPGNNGGDALAVARMLTAQHYSVNVYLFNTTGRLSPDCEQNRERLKKVRNLKGFTEITQEFEPPTLTEDTLVIDGLFGSGLNKPLTGGFASVVKYINASKAKVVSIDIPSGMMTEDNTYNVRANIIRADMTLTLGSRKLCMMMADIQPLLGEVRVLDINLSAEGIEKIASNYSIMEEKEAREMMLPRDAFVHKGNMGHALLIAGTYGLAGAGILAARACLRSGIGLSETTAIAVIAQIRSNKTPMVIDADALNVLASHRAWMQQLPEGLILTPHPKELDRLVGNASNDDFERLTRAVNLAQQLRAYVILKGHYTAICMPNGHVCFNSTGNAGMATAGSGDVLTGIITGLLARGYSREEASILGVYLHGLAGDLAANDLGEESLTAGDIINYLPKAFIQLKNK